MHRLFITSNKKKQFIINWFIKYNRIKNMHVNALTVNQIKFIQFHIMLVWF